MSNQFFVQIQGFVSAESHADAAAELVRRVFDRQSMVRVVRVFRDDTSQRGEFKKYSPKAGEVVRAVRVFETIPRKESP